MSIVNFMRGTRKKFAEVIIIPILILFILTGCGAFKYYSMSPNFDSYAIRKIAIFPLTDAPKAPGSGLSLTKEIYRQLARLPKYNIIDQELMEREIKERRLDPERANTAEIQEIGKALGADGIILGKVKDYSSIMWVKSKAPFNPDDEDLVEIWTVEAGVKLISVKTGEIIYSSEHSYQGGNPQRLGRDISYWLVKPLSR